MAKTTRRVLTVIACGAAVLALVLCVPWHPRWISILCTLGCLLFGLWTYKGGWHRVGEDRRDRRRRWGIRKRADARDRANADGE